MTTETTKQATQQSWPSKQSTIHNVRAQPTSTVNGRVRAGGLVVNRTVDASAINDAFTTHPCDGAGVLLFVSAN